MYVMKQEEVQGGGLNPLSQEEISRMTSFDGYADYTQALCDQAAIIHYIGETKPWSKERPDVPTYSIFDRYYHLYEKLLTAKI